jgi:hypothetical protein
MNTSLEIISEIRGWLTVLLSILGFTLAYKTYLNNQKQRRLENSFKLVSLFKESLQKDDIEIWKDIFLSCSEPSGSKEGYFKVSHYGDHFIKCLHKIDDKRKPENLIFEEIPFSYLFMEGSPDDGAIQRMAELFDLISFQILNETVDEKLIYFELGQLMDNVKLWLSFIDNPFDNKTFLEEFFPSFYQLYERRIIQDSWKKKTYANIG